MQENGDTEEVVPEDMDAVTALEQFIEDQCSLEIGRSFYVRKDEFERRYVQFCKDHDVEPPSPGVLGNCLVNCYRIVWADSVRTEGVNVPVWRNMTFKDQELAEVGRNG
jgi:hypothetical protein